MTDQVLTQVRKEKPVQKVKGSPGSYWVQSSRYRQLFYNVTLIPERDICRCTCEAFKFNPSIVCKHILKVIETENHWK